MLSSLAAFSVILFPLVSEAATRSGVNIVGTTTRPNFTRPTGTPLRKCPSSHPYVLSEGQQCCRASLKLNDTSLSPVGDCDGGRVRFMSSAECCVGGMMVPCSDQERGCNNGKSACQPNPTVISSDDPWSSDYRAELFLSWDGKCEVYNSQTYFLSKDDPVDFTVVIDFGCQVTMSKIYLRNTQNGYRRNFATRDFSIELSQDMTNWTEKTCRSLLVDDTLPDTLGLDNADCDIPTSSFQAVGFGRYLRFIAKNYHGSRGVGLNFMTWTFEL